MSMPTEIESLRSEISSLQSRLQVLETAERRRQQRVDLLQRPDTEPVRWIGDIGTFCEDLVFHAKALGRNVRGEFNGVPIVAAPDADPWELAQSYCGRRQP